MLITCIALQIGGGKGPITFFRIVGSNNSSLSGRASVIDGDTLEIRGERFRLEGVDTPESSQVCGDATGKDYPCGRRAALALSVKIGRGRRV